MKKYKPTDIKTKILVDFFEGLGAKFVDVSPKKKEKNDKKD